jgi:hypothetical protein
MKELGSHGEGMVMKKMELGNQILIVNLAVVGGLAFEYFRGAPVFAILVTGVGLLLLANGIFWIRIKRAKKSQ